MASNGMPTFTSLLTRMVIIGTVLDLLQQAELLRFHDNSQNASIDTTNE